MSARRTTGAALATAAAMLFTSVGISTAHAEDAKIHCMGVNGCKGQSACKTAANACKGQNSCKGAGFLELTAKQCTEAKASMGDAKK
jgi:hypothetical protein